LKFWPSYHLPGLTRAITSIRPVRPRKYGNTTLLGGGDHPFRYTTQELEQEGTFAHTGVKKSLLQFCYLHLLSAKMASVITSSKYRVTSEGRLTLLLRRRMGEWRYTSKLRHYGRSRRGGIERDLSASGSNRIAIPKLCRPKLGLSYPRLNHTKSGPIFPLYIITLITRIILTVIKFHVIKKYGGSGISGINTGLVAV
jgi:hypothetical protein